MARRRNRTTTDEDAIDMATVLHIIENYMPLVDAADAQLWTNEVGQVVRAWTLTMEPISKNQATNYLSYLSRFVIWSVKNVGDLSVQTVLSLHSIEYWIGTVNAHRTKHWRSAAHSVLERCARRLAPNQIWPSSAGRQGKPTPALPYDQVSEDALVRAAQLLRRDARPRRLYLVSAGFGAGLSGPELREIEGSPLSGPGVMRVLVGGGWSRFGRTRWG